MKYTEQEYIFSYPFQDESEIACRTVKIVKGRKPHKCVGLGRDRQHDIAVGEKHYYERALVDGSFWGEYRMCLTCLDKIIDGEEI